jgi:hypothetical protein
MKINRENVQTIELSEGRRQEIQEQNMPPVSDESMERLAQVMNNSPSLAKLAGTEWEIRALHPAVQWHIAEQACKVHNVEKATFGDVLDGMAKNLPIVVDILTYALLNDKERIKNEYKMVYEKLMWESNQSEWANLLLEVLNLLDVNFFFATTKTVMIFRDLSLQRKKTTEERSTSLRVLNGGR